MADTMTAPSPERERLARSICEAFGYVANNLIITTNFLGEAREHPQWMRFLKQADALLAAGYVHRDEAMEETAVVIGPEQAVVLRILLPKVRAVMDECEKGNLSHSEAWRTLIAAAEVKPRPAMRKCR